MDSAARAGSRGCLRPEGKDCGKLVRSGVSSVALLAMALVGVGIAQIFGPRAVRGAFEALGGMATHAGIACLLALASIFLHEGGHAAAALALGFRVNGGAVGPLRFTRTRAGWTCKFVLKNFFTGSLSALPGEENWRRNMLTVITAGSLTTALCAAVGIWAGTLAMSDLSRYAGAFGALNLVIFVLTLVPNGRKAHARNDARLFLTVVSNGVDAREMRLYQQLTRLRLDGVRPRAYPVTVVDAMARAHGRADLCLTFAVALTQRALECGEMESAQAWNSRAAQLLDGVHSGLRNWATAEIASANCPALRLAA